MVRAKQNRHIDPNSDRLAWLTASAVAVLHGRARSGGALLPAGPCQQPPTSAVGKLNEARQDQALRSPTSTRLVSELFLPEQLIDNTELIDLLLESMAEGNDEDCACLERVHAGLASR